MENATTIYIFLSYSSQVQLYTLTSFSHILIQQELSSVDHPMCYAADDGDLAQIKYLVSERGCDIDERGPDNCTPLMSASYKDHVKVVKYLLFLSADISATNCNGDTALHIAADNGCKDTLEVLLKKNPFLNELNSPGYTPLMLAVINRHKNNAECVELLLKTDRIDLDVRGNGDLTAKELAAKFRRMRIKRIIEKGGLNQSWE